MEILLGGDLSASFNPQRDWAHAYPRMIFCVSHLFDSEYWPQLFADLMLLHRVKHPADAEGCTPEEFREKVWDLLCDAADRYVTIFKMCAGGAEPVASMKQVYEGSGWLTVPSHVRAAYLAMLGEVMTSQLFDGLRQVTPQGKGPLPHIANLDMELRNARQGRAISQFVSSEEDLRIDLRRLIACCLANGLSREEIREEVEKMLR
jgi:hypothetical protein